MTQMNNKWLSYYGESCCASFGDWVAHNSGPNAVWKNELIGFDLRTDKGKRKLHSRWSGAMHGEERAHQSSTHGRGGRVKECRLKGEHAAEKRDSDKKKSLQRNAHSVPSCLRTSERKT